MGTWAYIKGVFIATWSGLRHLFRPRMTLRYPEQKLDLEGPGYQYDAKKGVGLPGFKGRHILYFEKCTGCQLCAIACDGVAVAIDMQKVQKGKAQNKKDIWPAVDYGRCVPPSTPIITIDGVKPISQIQVGDRVLTHTGKFRKVTKLFSRNYTGRLYTFWTSGNPQPLTTTEDHPILVFNKGEVSWSFANDIKCGMFLTRPSILELLPNGIQLSPELNGASIGQGSHAGRMGLISHMKSGTSYDVNPEQGIVVSQVIRTETTEVSDFLVRNLEVEEDNSYVAASQSVHNCVFCGLCIDPETEIATNPGLKQINQIAIGDMVLTHSGDYKPVTKVWDMQYSGPMYWIAVFGKPEPLACTADHPILAVSRPLSNRKDKRLLRVTSPLLFYKPGELKPGDYLASPIVRKVLHTDRYEKDVPMYRGGHTTRRLSLVASPELFRLIGYYYAEGSCEGGRRVNFDFNETERETYVRDCGDLLLRFFEKECKVKKNGEHGIRLALDSALAEDFFSQFGNGAPNKKMPDWVFFAEPEKQLELMRGEWQGDGCRMRQVRQEYLNITTTSKTLAFQLQSVYARLGIVATIDSEHPLNRLRCYHVNVFGRWAIKLAHMWNIDFDYKPTKHADKFQIDDRYVYLPIRKIEVEQVSDHRVMDVTVEDDHTFAPLGLATSNCVDACPFDALFMTNEYELSAYDRMSLKYTPDMLAIPPKLEGKKYKVEFDTEKGIAKHG
ncbi:MAG TPA: LAGLIDADG family homing endonuclease [Nitrososphaerales archaeon]|nr:LAGLIDADG family homing endonuclease [Nitrososphaerales archaeon]